MGIDPGLIVTGWGVIEGTPARPVVVAAGIIRANEKAPLEERLNELFKGVNEILDTYRPESMGVESLYAHYKHPATAILMGHARGVIFLAAGTKGVPVAAYSANSIKKRVVGAGHASKERVQRMVQAALGLKQIPEPPDVADALAVAITHLDEAMRKGVAR